MKLAECLNTADISTLRRIADHYGLPGSRHSKLSLLQEILFAFRDAGFLDRQTAEWRRAREHALLRLSMDTRSMFSEEELTGLFASCGLPENTLDLCIAEGWMFPTTRHGRRLLYCIPDELKVRIRQAVVEEFAGQVHTSDEGPLVYQDEEHALARDLDVFLEHVARHEIRLTVDGSMYKRHLMQVLELLEVPEQPLAGGWRFGYGRRFHDYPDRLALLYDFAYHHRYIDERDDGFLVVTDAAAEWVRLPALDRQRALMKFYVSQYRRPITRLPQVVQLIAHVATRWVESQSMLQALRPLINAYYYDSQEQVWNVRILKMLTHLGVIRRGEAEAGDEWFQITKLGQQLITPDALPAAAEDDRSHLRVLIVQPNFEMVVTADMPFVTSELVQFAELRQGGAVRIYRVSEDSVKRGLASGRSLPDWMNFVQRYAQTPIPGNVERTLKEWERQWQMQGGTLTS